MRFFIIDERLKLVSATLAGYITSIQDLPSQTNSIWNEMCKRLSLEMSNPYLRAIYSYIASGNWFDVLQEEELSLQDRIGIALRFLDDEEV
jgi:WD repeat-containing protein mio